MLIKKNFILSFFIFFVSFCFTDVVFCETTDLEINPKIITERGFSDVAITDRYNIELLTKESYMQADEIFKIRTSEYAKTQSNLFIGGDKQVKDIGMITSDLNLFKKGYSATQIDTSTQGSDVNIVANVLIILVGSGVGVILSIAIQKRKGTNK